MELEYGVESGEAERIAVDGVSKGGKGENDESAGEYIASYMIDVVLRPAETDSSCGEPGHSA